MILQKGRRRIGIGYIPARDNSVRTSDLLSNAALGSGIWQWHLASIFSSTGNMLFPSFLSFNENIRRGIEFNISPLTCMV